MELRQLTYTVVLSEELNFRKAANRLHMTQPPLSRQIKQLEAELGILLFNRSKNGVRLTEAGSKFVKEARKIIELVQSLPNKIEGTDNKETVTFHIGFIGLPAFAFIPELAAFLGNQEYRIKWTDYIHNQQLAIDLASGKLDLAFHNYIDSVPESIYSNVVFSEPLVMIINQDHPLRAKKVWEVADYAQQNYVLPPSKGNPLMVERFHHIARQMGFEPKVSQEFNSSHARLHLVAQGLGITFEGISAKKLGVPTLLYKPLSGKLASQAQVFCAWRQAEPPAIVALVLEFFQNFTQQAEIESTADNSIPGVVWPMV